MVSMLKRVMSERSAENVIMWGLVAVFALLVWSPNLVGMWWIYQRTDWSPGILPTLWSGFIASLSRPATVSEVLYAGFIVWAVSRPRRK